MAKKYITLTAQRTIGRQIRRLATGALKRLWESNAPRRRKTVREYVNIRVTRELEKTVDEACEDVNSKLCVAIDALMDAADASCALALEYGVVPTYPQRRGRIADYHTAITSNVDRVRWEILKGKPRVEREVLGSFPVGRKILQLEEDIAAADDAALALHFSPEAKAAVLAYADRHDVKLADIEMKALRA